MQSTPQSNRLTVSIFGRCNAGKSTLFNAITDTQNAIVSPLPGTTTDPVSKAMELLPHGPIVLVDTAGIGDNSALGNMRVKKTEGVLNRTDFALYVIDPANAGLEEYGEFCKAFQKRNIPHLVVLAKRGTTGTEEIETLQAHLPGSILFACDDAAAVEGLKTQLAQELDKLKEDHPLLAGLLPAGAVAVLVVPVDSEAPKGRLILPQVQLLRECLDNGIRCHVVTDHTLADAVAELPRIDLVVTDSQAFAKVAAILPEETPLTSFSILMARQKGGLEVLEQGATALAALKPGSRVLVAETCTHNRSHEDIGRVKIPKLLQQKAGGELQFTFAAGRDWPADLQQYDVIVHCGGCMVTRKEMENRLRFAKEQGVPITNYGMALAWCTGILQRSMQIIHTNTQNG